MVVNTLAYTRPALAGNESSGPLTLFLIEGGREEDRQALYLRVCILLDRYAMESREPLQVIGLCPEPFGRQG